MTRKDEYPFDASRTSADDDIDDPLRAGNASEPAEQVSEIRESIEQTRAGMSETIDELQERLSPDHLKQEVKEQVREQYNQVKETVRQATIGKVEDMVERVSDSVYETRRSIVDTVTANPIPSALVGIGLAWLWMNRRSASASAGSRYRDRYRGSRSYDQMSSSYSGRGASMRFNASDDEAWDGGATESARSVASRAGQAVSGMANQVQEKASNLADQARQTVTGAADRVQHTAGEWMNQAQHQARRVEDRFNGAMRESPLAVGAVALALGTAVGMAVPLTRKENEWMGDARDSFMDKAQSVAHDAIEQVQQVAQKVTDELPSGSNRASQGANGSEGGDTMHRGKAPDTQPRAPGGFAGTQ